MACVKQFILLAAAASFLTQLLAHRRNDIRNIATSSNLKAFTGANYSTDHIYSATLEEMYKSDIWRSCLSCHKLTFEKEYSTCLQKTGQKNWRTCVPKKVQSGMACCSGRKKCLRGGKGELFDAAVARCAESTVSPTPGVGCVLAKTDTFQFKRQIGKTKNRRTKAERGNDSPDPDNRQEYNCVPRNAVKVPPRKAVKASTNKTQRKRGRGKKQKKEAKRLEMSAPLDNVESVVKKAQGRPVVVAEKSEVNSASEYIAPEGSRCCCAWVDPEKYAGKTRYVALHVATELLHAEGLFTDGCPVVSTKVVSGLGSPPTWHPVCGCTTNGRLWKAHSKCNGEKDNRAFQTRTQDYLWWGRTANDACRKACGTSQLEVTKACNDESD